MKTCYACGTTKELEAFSISRREKDGRQSQCKACAKQYQQENKVRLTAYRVQYRIEHAFEIAERSAQCYRSSERGIVAKKRREDRELLFTQGLKRCSKCGEAKAFVMFDNSKSSRDGLGRKCKACNKKYEAGRKARKARRSKRGRGPGQHIPF